MIKVNKLYWGGNSFEPSVKEVYINENNILLIEEADDIEMNDLFLQFLKNNNWESDTPITRIRLSDGTYINIVGIVPGCCVKSNKKLLKG